MKIEYRKCLIPFSDGSENYKESDSVLTLPELQKEDRYAVGTDYCQVIYVEKKYLSETPLADPYSSVEK